MHKKRYNIQGEKRRKELLEAAGKVFAQKGYAGTSVRDIAKIAKSQPSALTYHFETKENLFRETLRYYILDSVQLDKLFEPFNYADPKYPETVSKAMYESIRNIIYICHKPHVRIKNVNGLIMILLKDGGKETNRMIQALGDKTMCNVYKVICHANRQLTPTDIYWFSNMLWALVFYPMYGELLLLAGSAENKYSEDFIDSMAARLTYACCSFLKLPIPEMIDKWTFKIPSNKLNCALNNNAE